MPAVKGWSFGYNITNTLRHVAAPMPDFATGDLVIAICSTDTGTQTWNCLDNISSAQYDDGGVFTDYTTVANNDTTADTFFVAVAPAVNDAFYIGSAGVFDSAWFQFSTAGAGTWTVTWEYWNGTAWTALAGVVDGTTGFKAAVTIPVSVAFTQPGDWASTTINSVAAYYIRGRVSAYTSITTRPVGTQCWVKKKWTQLFNVTSTINLAVFWKIADGTELDQTFVYSVAETADVHIVTVEDINPTTPFNGTGGAGTGYWTVNNSASRVAMPALVTTVNNSLILWINAESGSAVPGILEGACTTEDAADGSAHSDGFSWGFKPTAGTAPVAYGNKAGTAAGIIATIGISPPSGGAAVIPAHCAADASLYVDPVHGVTAYNGNSAFAATATTAFGTTLNGKTLANGTAAAGADVGLNSFHSMGQLTGVATAGRWTGAVSAIATANKPNVTGKNVLCHAKPSTPKVYQTTDMITKPGVNGVAFGMCSTNATAWKVWHVHGNGTPWNSAQHVPIVINSDNTAGVIGSAGSFNAASVLSFGYFCSGFVAAPVWQFGSLWVLDATTVAGGNAARPVGLFDIFKVCALGKERMSVLQQGVSEALVLQPIQFGNGGTNPLYMVLNATSIEFPRQYDLASKQVFYCSADNVAGLTYYAGATDVIRHTNSAISSLSPFHWRIHASSSASATYDFSGSSIIGAGDVTLRAVTTFSSMNFIDCPVITQNSAVIDNCGFTDCNIVSATPGDMDNISNCNFTSSGTGHAITVSGTATNITFSGNTFTGYAASNGVTGNEAIFVNIATGTMTISISGGGSTPSIRTAGATVTVQNAVGVSVTVKDATTLAVIPNARVRIVTTTGGNLVLAGVTNGSGVLSGSTTYIEAVQGYVRRATVADGTLYKSYTVSATVGGSGLDLTVLMTPD